MDKTEFQQSQEFLTFIKSLPEQKRDGFLPYFESLPEDVQRVVQDVIMNQITEETVQVADRSAHYGKFEILRVVVGGNLKAADRLADFGRDVIREMFLFRPKSDN